MDPATPAASPASRPWWLRIVRSVILITLATALMFLLMLAAIGEVPVIRAAFDSKFDELSSSGTNLVCWIALALAFLGPIILIIWLEKRRRLTWPVLAFAGLAVGGTMFWLSWDEPVIRRPLSFDEFSPAFPGADASFAVLMQYSKQHPTDAAKVFIKRPVTIQFAGASPRDPVKWREFVLKNRAGLEADWKALEPERKWLDELARFDRIGDLTEASYSADIMRFDVWRILSQRACAAATLQAIDGHGDEALATLLPLLEVSRRLEPSSRTLVRSMTARVVHRMSLETALVILDTAATSPESRQRIAAAIDGVNAPAGARRLVLMEYALFIPMAAGLRLGDFYEVSHPKTALQRPLNFLSSLLINPNATTNLYGNLVYELAGFAETRDLGKLTVRGRGLDSTYLSQGGMKNLGGRLMLVMAVPSYDRVLKSYWETEDTRAALLAKLQAH